MQEMENLIRRLNIVNTLHNEGRLTAVDMAYIVNVLLRDYYEQEKQKEVRG